MIAYQKLQNVRKSEMKPENLRQKIMTKTLQNVRKSQMKQENLRQKMMQKKLRARSPNI